MCGGVYAGEWLGNGGRPDACHPVDDEGCLPNGHAAYRGGHGPTAPSRPDLVRRPAAGAPGPCSVAALRGAPYPWIGSPPPPALKGLRTHVSQAQVALLSVVVAGGGVLVAALRKYCFDSPGATERFPFERHGQQRPTIRHGSTLFCSLLHTLLPTNSSVLFRAAAGDPEPGAGPGDGAVWVALGDGVGQSAADTLSPFRLKPYLDPLEAGSCSCSIKDPKTIAAARYGGGLLLKLVYFDGGLLIALQLAGLAGLCWLTSAVMAAAPICKTDGELPQKLWAAAMVLCVLGWLATATLVAAAGLWVRRPAGFANLGAHW